jgi:uncharacterized membrane protein
MNLKISTKTLALGIVYAALYVALTVGLTPLSYGPVQVRIADAMVALVPIFGWAGILGHTAGVFIANIFSTAGLLDLLNVIPSFAMAVVIWKLRKRSVLAGTILYSIVLAGTVGAMLSYLYGLPQLETYIYVLIGIVIATVGIGYPLYKAIKKMRIFQRWLGTGT